MKSLKTESSWKYLLIRCFIFTLCLLFLGACASHPAITATPVVSGSSTPTLIPSITPLPSYTPIPTAVPGGLYVDLAQNLGPISPLVYGTNYGPWLFVPLQMQDKAVAAKFSVVRFPGGNWGDLNDLDEWSIDQYISYARKWGAEPYITVRLKDGTPEKAAALVKYANITKKYNVHYWTIGNEPRLYGKDYTTEIFNKQWQQWAEAMRAVDPTIMLIGPEIDAYTSDFDANPKDSAGRDWMTEFLRVNGKSVNVVSIHRYPFPKGGAGGDLPTIDTMRDASSEWDQTIPYLRGLIREQVGRDLPIAITEVNSSWAANSSGEATMESHYNAIWWGDSLGRMIRQGVFMVNQFAIIGEFGLMDKYNVYPSYYVYLMYQKFGNERIYASSDTKYVSILASKREDGKTAIMVINLGSSEVMQQLTLANFTSDQLAETWLFDKAHNAEKVDDTKLGSTTTLKLSPESMTLFVIPSP